MVFQLDVQACCWHVVAMFRLAFYVKVSFFSSILFTRISTALGTFTFKVPLYQGRIIGLPWWFRWAHHCCFGRNDGPFTSPSAYGEYLARRPRATSNQTTGPKLYVGPIMQKKHFLMPTHNPLQHHRTDSRSSRIYYGHFLCKHNEILNFPEILLSVS